MKITKDLLQCLSDEHCCECGCEFGIVSDDQNSIDGPMIVKQILSNQEKAEKYDQYQIENWIAIPKADFETMRKELKEEEQENKRLKNTHDLINGLVKLHDGSDHHARMLFDKIKELLTKKEGHTQEDYIHK